MKHYPTLLSGQVLLACFLGGLLAGCSGVNSTISGTGSSRTARVYPMTAEQAHSILQEATFDIWAGARVSKYPNPHIGYKVVKFLGLDNHTLVARAILMTGQDLAGEMSSGYAFEVSHSGTYLVTGGAKAKKLYSRITEAANQLVAPVQLSNATREFDAPESSQTQSTSEKDRIRVGTGFFVTTNGYLITSHHVIKDARQILINYGGTELNAILEKADPINDLALLKVEGGFAPLPFAASRDVKLGDHVFTIGFPNIDLQGDEPKFTDGRISSLSGFDDDPRQFQISVPVQPGNSGGPVVDASGKVIGVITGGLNDIAALVRTGSIPQGVNYALKSSYVLVLLEQLRDLQLPRSGASKEEDATLEDAVDQVRKSVAIVMAR